MQSSSRDTAQMRVAQEDGETTFGPSALKPHKELKYNINPTKQTTKNGKSRAFLPNPATPANVTGNGRGDRDSPSGRHAAPPDRRMDHPSMSVHQTALLPI
ncbi:hypothetical protein CDAR_168621 [Caerostris darwini]|uniref:Uncharacterized protein n=1 Tax=Caerostris darwini TaxID=1538125 RepID=A0AAV4T4G8_9ARAC|nr:hypothetical protein CDAR_168621 [Caerostris darwini]